MTDDRRELQYRVEVQNRVYKKEVATLDAEIQKLERLLEQPQSSTSSTLDMGRHIKVRRRVGNLKKWNLSFFEINRTTVYLLFIVVIS